MMTMELSGGCCGSFGDNEINVTERHQCGESDVLGLMACDGVGVQWQNGDCVGLLWFWRCCAEPPLPFAVL